MPYLIILIVAVVICVKTYMFNKTTYHTVTGKNYFSVLFNVGDFGEYLTYIKLKKYERNGAKFLFNIYLPKDNGETTEIDVLMISESGLYVFESKNYSGWIFGDEKSKTWTQSLPSGRKSKKNHFLNPIMQNRLHIKWLNSILDNNDIPVHSIIVFSERCELKKVQVYSADIKVIKRDMVSHTVRSIAKTKTGVVTVCQVEEIYNKLYPYTQVSAEDKQKHIDNINAKVEEEKNVDEQRCPKCGAPLVLRMAKKGENIGNEFYGCSAFPKCRYIQK